MPQAALQPGEHAYLFGQTSPFKIMQKDPEGARSRFGTITSLEFTDSKWYLTQMYVLSSWK